LSGEGLTEFTNPNARFTTVLVIGAAGRVGRVLVRKLLLRGYTVKALVRNQADAENLPTAVDARFGDVSDASAMESGTCFGGFPKLRHWLVRTVFARTSHGKKMHRW
jgi:nucleoside-diphosphate-sugar epimerase